jgi:hypothetical protein
MRYKTSLLQIFLTERGEFVESLRRNARRAASIWTVLKIALLYAIFGGLLYLSGDPPVLYYVIVAVVVAVAVPLHTISKGIREDLGYTRRKTRAEQLDE